LEIRFLGEMRLEWVKIWGSHIWMTARRPPGGTPYWFLGRILGRRQFSRGCFTRRDSCMLRSRRSMTLSGTLITGQKGRNRCPPIAVDLEDHGVVVLGFQTN
jgi:hypothetical protein